MTGTAIAVLSINTELSSLARHPTAPVFDIEIGGRRVGYISRGHAMVDPLQRRNGYFAQALAQLETFERGLFAADRFDEYRRAILSDLGRGSAVHAPSLLRLSEPFHLDFWRLPRVAAYLLERGYCLAPLCVDELERLGLAGLENPRSTAKVLRARHLELKGLPLVLMKRPLQP